MLSILRVTELAANFRFQEDVARTALLYNFEPSAPMGLVAPTPEPNLTKLSHSHQHSGCAL